MKNESEKEDAPELLELAEFESPFAAQIVKQILESHGIPSLQRGKGRATRYDLVYETFGLNAGRSTLFVNASDLERARELLAEAKRAGESLHDEGEESLESEGDPGEP